jgi:hypothetical protein
MNIDRIIKEEINNFILSEMININSLSTYSNEINNALSEPRTGIMNINTSGFNNNLKKFFEDLTKYAIQIITAINRCIQANNLNEASFGGLSNYGINLPGELGGNLWSDAKQGYYNTKNFFQRGGRYGSVYNNANGKRINQNTVPSEKLSVLLQNLQIMQREYNYVNSRFGIDNYTMQPNNLLFRIIPSLQTEYTNMINAQNTNP